MARFVIVGGGGLSRAVAAAGSHRAPATWITRHSTSPWPVPPRVDVVRIHPSEAPDIAAFAEAGAHIVWALGGAHPSSAHGRLDEALERELQPLRANRIHWLGPLSPVSPTCRPVARCMERRRRARPMSHLLSGVLGLRPRIDSLPRRECDVQVNILDTRRVRRSIPFDPVALAKGLEWAVQRVDR